MATHDITIQYLTITRIGEKGQVTVPKEFRQDVGLAKGAPVAVLRLGDGLILLPQQRRFEQLCERISSRLAEAGVTPGQVLGTLPQTRDEIFTSRYGNTKSKRSPGPPIRHRRKK